MNTYQYKLVLLGESGVGKSSLAMRFVKGQFQSTQESTIGAAFLTQTVELSDEMSVKFEIWDTAGQERYHSLAPMYYRGAQAAMVIFDVSTESSFQRAREWIIELQNHQAGTVADRIVVLVANKIDLDRNVSKESAMELAREFGLQYVEVSAKIGQNVDDVFRMVGKLDITSIAEKLPKRDKFRAGRRETDGSSGVNLAADLQKQRTSSCC